MKKTINIHDFRAAFERMGRNDHFSHDGLEAIFGWIEDMEEGTGEEVELDVIGLCCDFAEYKSALECVGDLGEDFKPDEDASDEENEEAALEYLLDRTSVIPFYGGIIIQNF